MIMQQQFRYAIGAFLLSALLVACVSAPPEGDYLINADEQRLMLEGFDPVAMFRESQLIKGSPEQRAEYHGGIYQFSSAANRDAFEASPAAFAPQFGGFCAMSMALGMLEPADPTTWSIVEGRLVVQRNAKAVAMWEVDPLANLAKADGNWPGMVAKYDKRG